MKDDLQTSLSRLKDRRFLSGRGRYVADISLARQTLTALVLSTHAHAKLGAIDTFEAEQMEAVLTIQDVLADDLGPVPPFFLPAVWGGPEGHATLWPTLVSNGAAARQTRWPPRQMDRHTL